MLSDNRFQTLQSEYFGNQTGYDKSNPHYEKAKLLLIALSEIEEIHEELIEKYNDGRHWAQQKFITRSIDDVLSAFLLTSNHFYSSAYRDVRGLYETFLLINHMNDHKIKTAKVHWKQERDLEEIDVPDEKLSWEELYIEDAFHGMLEAERERLEDDNEELGQLYNYFSNRHVHPARFDGVDLQRNYVEEEERQLLDWLTDIVLGLIYQLIKLYSDTEDFRYTVNQLQDVGEQIEETHNPQPFLDIAEEGFPGSNE